MQNGGRRGSWVGYALACHLLNDYDTALQVLSTCRGSEGEQNSQPNKPDPEASEVTQYINAYTDSPNISQWFPTWGPQDFKICITVYGRGSIEYFGIYGPA